MRGLEAAEEKCIQHNTRLFFNYLASNSNQRLYSQCLKLIYAQYEREISYRIPRNLVRDSLAIYLLENHVSLDADDETGPMKNHTDLASAILRKFLSEKQEKTGG